MTDRPILFSAPMIRALLDGRKTQTRRILKGAPTEAGWFCYTTADGKRSWVGPNGYPSMPCMLRFAKGDRLWVREAWRTECTFDETAPRDLDDDEAQYLYEADGTWIDRDPMTASAGRLRAAMHMPRWASRLTLTVTDVRVQRLQEISMDDAAAEGLRYLDDGPGAGFWVVDDTPVCGDGSVEAYSQLWELINGAGSWKANPWIVAVTFTVERRNIDAVPA